MWLRNRHYSSAIVGTRGTRRTGRNTTLRKLVCDLCYARTQRSNHAVFCARSGQCEKPCLLCDVVKRDHWRTDPLPQLPRGTLSTERAERDSHKKLSVVPPDIAVLYFFQFSPLRAARSGRFYGMERVALPNPGRFTDRTIRRMAYWTNQSSIHSSVRSRHAGGSLTAVRFVHHVSENFWTMAAAPHLMDSDAVVQPAAGRQRPSQAVKPSSRSNGYGGAAAAKTTWPVCGSRSLELTTRAYPGRSRSFSIPARCGPRFSRSPGARVAAGHQTSYTVGSYRGFCLLPVDSMGIDQGVR